jgi:hypothetical protein
MPATRRRVARRRNPTVKARSRAADIVETLDAFERNLVRVRRMLADLREEVEGEGYRQTQNMKGLFDHLVLLGQATTETLRFADAVEREIFAMNGED